MFGLEKHSKITSDMLPLVDLKTAKFCLYIVDFGADFRLKKKFKIVAGY
jgi:hypothetical protein